MLNRFYSEEEAKTNEAKARAALCERELMDSKRLLADLSRQYDDMITWSTMDDESPMDTKKMILSHIVKRVRVRRNYELEIDMNISCEQFVVVQ